MLYCVVYCCVVLHFTGLAVRSTGCLTSTETTGLIRDGEKGGGGMEVGGEGYYIPIATLSPPE